MNVAPTILKASPGRLSDAGKARLLSVRGEPLFLAHWERALFFHYEIDAEILQRELPFELDLRNGKAFISLVVFTMRNMRPRIVKTTRLMNALPYRKSSSNGNSRCKISASIS